MNTSRCQKCGTKAVIYMRQHRLPLCRSHYLDWFIEQTDRFIKKYGMFTRQDKILVAISGGKDSLSLWDVLIRAGYNADGLYIDLGIKSEDDYSQQSKAFAQSFAQSRNLHLHVFDLEDQFGKNIIKIYKQARHHKDRPCSICGVIKRHVMNQVTRDNQYTILATGHNLDDEAAVLLSNTLSWSIELLARQYPVLDEEEGFARKVKPFCRFYERETAAYAILRGIEYISEECPFSIGSTSLYYKGLLNQLEHAQPGTKLRFYGNFTEAHKNGVLFPKVEKNDLILHPCSCCGQPTTSEGECYYCRLITPRLEEPEPFPPGTMMYG